MTSKEEPASTPEMPSRRREHTKHRAPNFKRQESWRYKRLKESWRKPKGIDSKMRKKVKGWPSSPVAGYRTPKKTRGLHPSGYKEVLVHSLDDLEKIDSEMQAIRIAHTVGTRKRIEISTEAREKGIHILNPMGVREFEDVEDDLREEPEDEKEVPVTESEGAKE